MRAYRTVIWGLAAASFFAGGTGTPDSLRKVAERSGILVGAAVRPEQLSEDEYAKTLASEFNMLEPEDAMKWETVHPTVDRFDFSQADRIVEFAISQQMKIRGHTLVWHRQNPKWLMDRDYNPVELRQILERHIKTVVRHYRGKVFAWDVVNEAFDEKTPTDLRSTIWYDQPGIGGAKKQFAFIAQCFRWAHESDPDALLFYNEAQAEAVNAKSDAVYAMLREFKRDGVPINGVGLQMHIGDLHPDIESISENIGRFTALGLQVHITEMDVALPVDAAGNPNPEDLKRQAQIYGRVAKACLDHPGCTGIQMWGFTDKYSWIGSHSHHSKGAALLFDRNYGAKPSYEELRTALSQANRR